MPPAPALTTRCISFSNGRYGHPQQDRAISVREAALLQTLPMNFALTGSLTAQARQIGNAVPALLSQRFGEHVVVEIKSRNGKSDGAREDPSSGTSSLRMGLARWLGFAQGHALSICLAANR